MVKLVVKSQKDKPSTFLLVVVNPVQRLDDGMMADHAIVCKFSERNGVLLGF